MIIYYNGLSCHAPEVNCNVKFPDTQSHAKFSCSILILNGLGSGGVFCGDEKKRCGHLVADLRQGPHLKRRTLQNTVFDVWHPDSLACCSDTQTEFGPNPSHPIYRRKSRPRAYSSKRGGRRASGRPISGHSDFLFSFVGDFPGSVGDGAVVAVHVLLSSHWKFSYLHIFLQPSR